MASLTGKVEKEVEIDALAEKFYKLWKSEFFHVCTTSPSNIQGVEVHEGDWETGDSIKIRKYTMEGRAQTFKEKVEADDEYMTVTFHGIERDLYKNFKFLKPIYKVAPKQWDSGSVTTVSIKYEKRNKDVPDPVAYVDFMASVSRDVASHIMKT
ncbi:MLP-like protein 28 [Pistacia vera]|uniref:MLP-like protein 28 n=1 Tax=Pistacia vera TaxID=55513 RepID=UPI001262F501|nr:MLP-like protein 28 [Pistacia vera]